MLFRSDVVGSGDVIPDYVKFDTGDNAVAPADTDEDAPNPNKPSCENYCKQILLACNGAQQQYTGEEACLNFCKQSGKLAAGAEGDTEGNTVGCRMHYTALAAESVADAAKYCAQAGPTGGNVCGSWCGNYCALALMNCTAEHKIYSAPGDCPVACAALDTSAPANALSGDSVQCRLNWLGDRKSTRLNSSH